MGVLMLSAATRGLVAAASVAAVFGLSTAADLPPMAVQAMRAETQLVAMVGTQLNAATLLATADRKPKKPKDGCRDKSSRRCGSNTSGACAPPSGYASRHASCY